MSDKPQDLSAVIIDLQRRIEKLEQRLGETAGGGVGTTIMTGYTGGDLNVTGKLEIPRTALSMTQQEIIDAIYKWITSLLTGNAASGQKDVAVTDGTKFSEDEIVVIRDDNAYETNTIASIAGNTLTMATNLANTYTVAASGIVDRWEPEGFAAVARPFRLKDDTTGQYIDSFLVTVSDSSDDPIYIIDQALVVKKDFTVGGFLGANQGALYLGSRLLHTADTPRIVLMHSGSGFNTLYIRQLDNTLAHLKCANIYGTSLTISDTEVITSTRILQNVTANASIITAGSFGLSRMPTGTNGYVLTAKGAGINPAYEAIGVPGAHETTHRSGGSDAIMGALHLDAIPALPASKITSGTFDLARIPTMDDAHIPDLETLSYGAAFALAQIPTIPHTKTDFADQALLQASDVVFLSAKGTNQNRALSLESKDASETVANYPNRDADLAWTDVDVTAETSSVAKMAYVQINMTVDVVGLIACGVALRKNGTTPTDYPALIVDDGATVTANYTGLFIVGLDSDQIFEVDFIANGFQIDIEVNVLAYWE